MDAVKQKILRVDPSVHKQVKSAAVKYEIPMHELTEKAVKKYLEELEGANA